MMKMKKLLPILLALLLMLCGCTEKVTATESQEAFYDAAAATGTLVYASANGNTASVLPENRKWVITMGLSAETENLESTMEVLSDKITAMGGYIENQSLSGHSRTGTGYRHASLTIRIPAEQADLFVCQVEGSTNVTSSSRQVEDITLTYTDTENRVNALRTEQQRLLELLEQAENMTDLLEIEARLTEVRSQLETHASTLRLYENQVDYATVNLTIREVERYTPAQPTSFWEKASSGLKNSIRSIADGAVEGTCAFIIVLPYLALVALILLPAAWLLRRHIRRKKNAK